MNAREAVIVGAVRTPVGKRGGALSRWHPADLLGHTLRNLVERSAIDAKDIDDVIVAVRCSMSTSPEISGGTRCWLRVYPNRAGGHH